MTLFQNLDHTSEWLLWLLSPRVSPQVTFVISSKILAPVPRVLDTDLKGKSELPVSFPAFRFHSI